MVIQLCKCRTSVKVACPKSIELSASPHMNLRNNDAIVCLATRSWGDTQALALLAGIDAHSHVVSARGRARVYRHCLLIIERNTNRPILQRYSCAQMRKTAITLTVQI